MIFHATVSGHKLQVTAVGILRACREAVTAIHDADVKLVGQRGRPVLFLCARPEAGATRAPLCCVCEHVVHMCECDAGPVRDGTQTFDNRSALYVYQTRRDRTAVDALAERDDGHFWRIHRYVFSSDGSKYLGSAQGAPHRVGPADDLPLFSVKELQHIVGADS